MRPLAAAVLAFGLSAAPAAAADSIADQAHNAYQIFTGGVSQPAFLGARYGEFALKNVDGKWAPLNGPDIKSGIESYGADTDRICASPQASVLASPDPLTLTVTSTTPRGSFTQTYALIAGTTFGAHVDDGPYLNALGLGLDNTSDAAAGQRSLALSIANGIVQIYRPSDDILVMTRDRGYPLVLARCPRV